MTDNNQTTDVVEIQTEPELKKADLPGRLANGRFIEDYQYVALMAFVESLPINKALNMYHSLSSLPQVNGMRIVDGPVPG